MAACGPPWGWAIHPSSCLLSAWGIVPHGLARPGVPTGPDRTPFRCLSRAASPRVRKLARTWRLADLGVAYSALAWSSAWGDAVVGVREWGDGECRGARAMLTGLDPHPAPTPLNNSVSISGTRLPLMVYKIVNQLYHLK